MIKPEGQVDQADKYTIMLSDDTRHYTSRKRSGVKQCRLCTLNDGQQDNNDKEEEGDVKQDAVELVGVSCGVLQLISDTTSSSHSHIHVEHIALPTERHTEGEKGRVTCLDLQSFHTFFS